MQSLQQKWDFFHMLIEIGFTEIEVSFPVASQVEFDFTRRLVETPGAVPDNVRLRALCPTREDFLARSVAALQGAKRACICAYICVSDKQLKYQGFSREEAVRQAVNSVRYLRSITKDDAKSAAETKWSFAFGLEAYNESAPDYALHITEAVKEAWGPTREDPMVVVLATSTEQATPNVFADQVECFKAALSDPDKIQISVHTHNDRGCAVAAAELGLLAGADIVEGCLFGNGERCGNADLVTLALNLYSRGISPGLDFSNLHRYKKEFEKFTGLQVAQRSPYAGDFSFLAFSGGHQNLIRRAIKNRDEQLARGVTRGPIWDVPYLPIDPEDLGMPLDEIVRVNSQSGKAAAAWILGRRWGLEMPPALQADFARRVQPICESVDREITHQEVLNLFIASYGLRGSSSGGDGKQVPFHEPFNVKVTRLGPGQVNVVASVQMKAKGLTTQLNGSGDDIPAAVLAGLRPLGGAASSATAAKIEDSQQLDLEHDGGKWYALASCETSDKLSWGFALHTDQDAAQVLAIVSAAVVSTNAITISTCCHCYPPYYCVHTITSALARLRNLSLLLTFSLFFRPVRRPRNDKSPPRCRRASRFRA